jgi:MOSC domain-containing protein YiiM
MDTIAAIAHRSLDQLRAFVPHIAEAPRDHGTVRLVVRRPAVGVREVLDAGQLLPEEGLAGDTWRDRACSRSADRSPHPEMQITLMSIRAIGAISPDDTRWPLAGDQLFVDLDLSGDNLPPGTRLDIGSSVLEVTAQPHTGCARFIERFGIDAMKWVNSAEGRALNLRGIYARVVTAGEIRPGDTITKRASRLGEPAL